MKTIKFLSTIFAVLVYYGGLSNDNPVFGEQLVGRIIPMGMPSWDTLHPSPGAIVLGLETSNGNYMILFDSRWIIGDRLIVEDNVYLIGSEVEITGKVTIRQNVNLKEVKIIDIETIKHINEQNIYVGKISWIWNPSCVPPVFPPCPAGESEVLGLKMLVDDYILLLVLSFNSNLLTEKLTIGNIEYFVDDNVEITGHLRGKYDEHSRQYVELEIENIKKVLLSIQPLSSDKNKIYFDAAKRLIVVLDETLQNQSLTFELVDIQGKVILRKTDIDSNFIDITNLSNGVYLYRLLQNNKVISSGKIIK
jgi:hypothetical protein